jgi:hypothetical protein
MLGCSAVLASLLKPALITAWPPLAPRALAGGERPRISLLLPQPCDRVLRDVIGEVVTFGEMLILETNSVG